MKVIEKNKFQFTYKMKIIGNVSTVITSIFPIVSNVIDVRRKKKKIQRYNFSKISNKDDKPKRYQPNPDDWKCLLCGNFNYARRDKCNRCKEEKSKSV